MSDHNAVTDRLLSYPGDWRRLAHLLLDTRGPGAFTDGALQAMTRIIDALECRPEAEKPE